jgi:hypothetical protein
MQAWTGDGTDLSLRRRWKLRLCCLSSVHLKADGGGVGPLVELVTELVGHPQAPAPVLSRSRGRKPG